MFLFYKYFKTFIADWSKSSSSPKQSLPTVIQFPINNICNSRCQMCDIWQQKKGRELSIEEIKNILSNPLYRNVTSVGINGGEPTLRKDFIEIISTVIDALPSLSGISLITNAIQSNRVIHSINEFSKICHDRKIHSDVMISVDGFGSIHDIVRGRKGNFDSASKVIEHVLSNDFISTKRLGCTIINENSLFLESLHNWAVEKNIYIKYRLGVPHKRLYSNDGRSTFNLSKMQKFHVANFLDYVRIFYEKDFNQKSFYLSLRNQLVYGSKRVAGCNWKSTGVTLLSNGDLAYCAVESPVLGNTLYEDSYSMYWKNKDHLRSIIKNKCHDCVHDYVGIGSRKTLIIYYFHKVFKKLPLRLKNITLTIYNKFYKLVFSFSVKKQLLHSFKNFNYCRSNDISKILLCGWYGTETLGDKAILAGILNTIKEHSPDTVVDLASLEPYVSAFTLEQMPDLAIDNNISIKIALKLLNNRNYDCVVIAGGPLMSPITRSLELLKLFSTAKKNQIKTCIVGCGVGPLTNDFRDNSIRGILKLADSILLRDQKSFECVKNYFNLNKKIDVGIDPAFLWINKFQSSFTRQRNRRILFALREWPINEYASSINPDKALRLKSLFEAEIIKLKDLVKKKFEVYPFSMHKYAVGGDDRFYHNKLWKNDADICSLIDWQHQTPEHDLKQFYNSCGIVAMRFHSVVFAIATCTPFIAVDYTEGGKIASLLTMLGLNDRLFYISNLNASIAYKKLSYLIHNNEESHIDSEILSKLKSKIVSNIFN